MGFVLFLLLNFLLFLVLLLTSLEVSSSLVHLSAVLCGDVLHSSPYSSSPVPYLLLYSYFHVFPLTLLLFLLLLLYLLLYLIQIFAFSLVYSGSSSSDVPFLAVPFIRLPSLFIYFHLSSLLFLLSPFLYLCYVPLCICDGISLCQNISVIVYDYDSAVTVSVTWLCSAMTVLCPVTVYQGQWCECSVIVSVYE